MCVNKVYCKSLEISGNSLQLAFPPPLGLLPAPLKKSLSKASSNTPVLRFRLFSRPTATPSDLTCL